ncbi:MAG: transporter ATP-binding protein [Novosphingobium sp.]|nr:transporter ATP-binding protein [Novosphingobium sp.]
MTNVTEPFATADAATKTTDAAIKIADPASKAGTPAAAPKAKVVVRVRNLVRRFTMKGVLNGVDLDIRNGEFVALLGTSGSGKSTLLRALANLDHEAIGSGDIQVPERLSVVFQDARLLPWKRLLENVTLGLDDPQAAARGRRTLEEVGLGGRERSWPYELSGGEQQRVALARSLVRQPDLLLADEPFGALDALTRIKMHALVKKLTAVYDPAVLLVTHDVEEAISLADRVIVLDEGVIVADIPTALPDDKYLRARRITELRVELLRHLGVEVDEGEAG